MLKKTDLFSIKSENDFNQKALEVFQFQSENCTVYKQFLSYLDFKKPTTIEEIPFLPISFFKSHKVITGDDYYQNVFKSSGTSKQTRSQHFIKDIQLYKHSFLNSYQQFIGNPEDQIILALLPNYIEQGDSSLVYMANELINKTKNCLSGFILNDINHILESYSSSIKQNKKLVLLGVSYALMDIAKEKLNLEKAIVIETGGMKGRRKEITKEELHKKLTLGLNQKDIFSEYGMTELLSQAYSKSKQTFQSPRWMKIIIRDLNDPFKHLKKNRIGGINIIDLANLNSCAFIATEDLGKKVENGFQVTGRIERSEQRGCNLLMEDYFN